MLFRILLSAVLLPGFIWELFLLPPCFFTGFISAVFVVGYYEYAWMLGQRGLKLTRWLGIFWVVALCLRLVPPGEFGGFGWGFLSLLHACLDSSTVVPALVISFALVHVIKADPQGGLAALWADIFGPLYLAGLGGFLLLLIQRPLGGWWVFLVFTFSWMYDAGAYFTGKTLGRTSLSALSPRKTVEGLVGGLLVSMAFAALKFAPFCFPADFPLNRFQLVLAAAGCGLLAQAGDLMESMLKRYAGVKDSGPVLSKLGGVLDKADSALFIAPVLYWVATHLN